MYKKYFAEFIGTFGLAFVVLLIGAVGMPGSLVAIVAALTLGLFVYTIGPVSGCHINPAVTLAQLSVKKITAKDALFYILIQFLAAVVAVLVSSMFVRQLGSDMFTPVTVLMDGGWQTKVFFAEIMGTLFFGFGIASVVFGKVKEQVSGFVVGGSLLLGALLAAFAGAAGFLNPAIALTATYGNLSLTSLYFIAPVIGAVAGFQLYKFLVSEKQV
jgi:aquaporin Z